MRTVERGRHLAINIRKRAEGGEYPYSFWPDPPWDRVGLMPKPPGMLTTQRPPPRREEYRFDPEIRQRYIYEVDAWKREGKQVNFLWKTGGSFWPHGDPEEWVGVKYLGGGSYGSAGLWIKVNEVGTIVDVSTSFLSVPFGCNAADAVLAYGMQGHGGRL